MLTDQLMNAPVVGAWDRVGCGNRIENAETDKLSLQIRKLANYLADEQRLNNSWQSDSR